MILRISVIIILLVIFLLVVLPFVLYALGINIFPAKRIALLQKTQNASSLGVLMRSINGGSQWENVARSENPAIPFPASISSFVIDPTNSNIIYLGGVQSGLWKSINSGRTWSPIIDASRILAPNATIYDIEILRTNSHVIYVAADGKNHGKILQSIDGGAHFSELYATLTKNASVFDIVLNPFNIQHILAVTSQGALLETTNGGQSWRIKKLFSRPLARLIVSPATIEELYIINGDGKVFKSVTAGSDWSDPIGETSEDAVSFEYPPRVFDFFGGAVHAPPAVFMLDPLNSSRLYLGEDKRLLRSEDAGLTWQKLNLLFPQESLPVTAMAIDPHKSNTLFVVAAHTLHTSGDDGATWRNVDLPVGFTIRSLFIHPQDSNNMFAIIGR